MQAFWKAALKVGGPVAIAGFVVWYVVTQLFKQAMLQMFDSQQRFVLTLILVSGVLVCLLAAIITFRPKNANNRDADGQRSAIFNRSTIKGDVVLGDKHDGRKK